MSFPFCPKCSCDKTKVTYLPDQDRLHVHCPRCGYINPKCPTYEAIVAQIQTEEKHKTIPAVIMPVGNA